MTWLDAAVVMLDALLLWAVARTTGWWAPKVAAVVVVLGFNTVVWTAGVTLTGWPRNTTPPAGATILSCQVQEPDAIYLWVVPTGNPRVGYRAPDGTPRAYAVPYTRRLHADCEASKKARQQGLQAQVARRGHGRGNPSDHESGTRLVFRMPVPPPPKGS